MTKSKNYYKKSRDNWKQKNSERQAKIKLLKLENRDVRISREKWKNKSLELEQKIKELEELLEKQTLEKKSQKS